MIGIGELSLQPSLADDSVPCTYDFDYDRDVDGSDLAEFATEFGYELDLEDLALFAQEFGKDDCLISINFTHVPEYPNPGNENLEGNVTGVNPDDYFVAVYIRVEDVWWTKPYYASPKRPIKADGTWICDITTGGNDRYATEVAAYLLPEGEGPPICGPCCKLPEIPEAVAFCHKIIKEPRTVSFAGYDWKVKLRDFPAGPGPNYFSDREEDVWVDEQGLHLTISERNGDWYCSEVILDASFGYGSYIFQTQGRVDIIDPMMVLGLFTWDTEACDEHYREMDIEFTRWGNAGEYTNAQYVVHPCSQCPGCGDRCTRFRVDLTDEESDLTHYLVWQSDTVEFRTYCGKHSDSYPIAGCFIGAGEVRINDEPVTVDDYGGYRKDVVLTYGLNIVAATHDGRHVFDTHGNVYQTSDHTLACEPLPFSQSAVYPVFSSDDIFCYAGTKKIRFADRTESFGGLLLLLPMATSDMPLPIPGLKGP
jgi:hypothetical protein